MLRYRIELFDAPNPETMKGRRDLALLAILVACGLRRHEAVELNVSHLQQREDHWAVVDLIGKAAQASDESAWITGEVIRAAGGLVVAT